MGFKFLKKVKPQIWKKIFRLEISIFIAVLLHQKICKFSKTKNY